MKKFYFFLLGLFALAGLNSAQAREVVTDTSTWVTDLSTLKQGDKIMLYCYGEASRRAFLMESPTEIDEGDEANGLYQVLLNRGFELNTYESNYYIFTLTDYAVAEDGQSAQMKLTAASGHVFGTFPVDESSQWTRWPGKLYEDVSQIADLTITIPEDDGIQPGQFYIMDPNGVYFNGQESNSITPTTGKFVGWNSTGANSIYMLKKAVVEDKNTITGTIITETEDGIPVGESSYDVEVLLGDSISAMAFENYSFLKAYDAEENEVKLPYYVTEEDLGVDGSFFLRMTYAKWPEVTVTGVDEENNELYTIIQSYELGTKFTAPEDPSVKLGYDLVTTDYNDHVFTVEDDQAMWTLTYRKNPTAGLPFTPTTVTDGKFADDTKFYRMRIRNAGWIYSMNEDSTAVNVRTSGMVTDSIEYYVWAFTGNLEEGFKIYNLANGAAKQIYLDNTVNETIARLGTADEIAALGEEGTGVFNMIANNKGGYTFSHSADATACLNQSGGASSTTLATWTNANSPNDNGSNIVFSELTADDIQAYKFLNANLYLNAEGCVGGYTADKLTALKAAVAAKDLAACNSAIQTLQAETDTIAFDASKTYQIIAGYPEFVRAQPGVTYAVYASADDSVRWDALQADDEAYQWVFAAASDTTYTITNLKAKKAIVGWRFGSGAGSQAVLDGAVKVGEKGDNEYFATGEVAPFQIKKSGVAPASYTFTHRYGTPNGSYLTFSGEFGSGKPEATSGRIHTYNNVGADYNNIWRLKPVGDVPTGIGTSVITPTEQTEAIYDLSGRRVSKAAKGLYIINGKKVLVK